ncbi:MAG: AAA family ATPase [Candidatus Omnitrophica bacterium]|nr:AAA family ATPase [Candidatus Omnitrophota bacterium]
MYFKKLEIFGFKSFADRTILNFEPGITAVVGPNGCGKSNIFDAIRWVLGEQSVRQLRGGAMEDVIFNGTDTKLALGFAEVSVTFANESRVLAIPSDEVIVTRRLFRSGESEYLINKDVVRLKDIAELFMGTGVGAEAYSLVQQGKVDLVVSARPDDRRMIFDEAAGITKYKTKKREATNKLKETDDNLLRLNDIVVEVKRQIGSIERQAQKAQKYKAEFEKLKGLEQIFAFWQMNEFDRDKAAIQALLAEIDGKEGEITTGLVEYRQVVERESLVLEELESKVQEVREQDLKFESQLELNNRQIGFNEERVLNIDQNEKRIVEKKAQLVEKCRQYQEKIEELERMLSSFKNDMDRTVTDLDGARSMLTQVSALIEEYQQTIKADEENILTLTARQIAINNECTEIMKESQGYLARRRRLDVEQAKVTAEKEELEKKLQGLSQGLSEILARRAKLEADLACEKSSLAAHHEALNGLNASIDRLEKKKLFLISQKDFIEKLQIQYQDIPDPVITGRFLSSVAPTEKQSGVIGKVKTVRHVEAAQYESLKAHLENLEGDGLYEVICETKFIELDPLLLAEEISRIEEEVKGLLWERDAKVVLVAEQSRIIERIQQEMHIEDRRLSVCEAQQNDIGLEAQKRIQELETVLLEISEAEEGLIRLGASETHLKGELQSVNDEITRAREEIRGRLEMITEKRKEREDAAVLVAQVESEMGSMKEREKSWQENLKMFQDGMNGYLEELQRLNEESSSFGARREQYHQEIDALSLAIEETRVAREALRETLSRHEAEEEDVAQRLTSIRTQILGMEKELADNRDLVHDKAMKVQQIDFQTQAVKERMLQRYNIDLSAVVIPEEAATAEGVAPAEAVAQPEINIEALREEIQMLSKRCDGFGAVNLVAIEEFEELKARYQFLTKQQADLLEAKVMLEQTIRKINRTTREMFIETFTKVNEQFKVYFRMLFNGGDAQLILIDPENALESGIEIVARPPGKKLQTISLMSGGEKTMTAIAMIFAVFKVNPSPFCVLDEIDAALDEANVDRFAAVLKEFAKIAQFIVITHNKKTIAHADVMYGITMQQTGVSRVVSVKFSDKKEAAVAGSIAAEPEAAPVVEVKAEEQASALEQTDPKMQEELAAV